MALAASFDLAAVERLIDEAYAVPVDAQRRLVRGRRIIGKDLFFSKFDTEIVVDVFLAVVEHFPVYAKAIPKYEAWSARGCSHLLHLIVQSFMTALIPFMPSHATKKKRKEGENEKSKEAPPNSPMRVTDRQRLAILEAVIPMSFSVESKFWGLCCHALELKNDPAILVSAVMAAMSRGEASFVSLEHCLHEPWLSIHILEPSWLVAAGLLGPLRALTVEAFAANRPKEFRARCREMLLHLERCANSKPLWQTAVGCYYAVKNPADSCRFVETLPFHVFSESVRELMKEMQGAPPADDRIDVGWAHVAIKKCASKYYTEKSWRAENLQEVIWTILAQRPFMKRYVIETLASKFNDPVEADKWKTFHVPQHMRTKIRYNDATHVDPRSLNPPFLSIPSCVETVEFVRHASHLKRVENLLEDCVLGDFPVVGLDAEWSSYVSHSKATVLQMAMRTKVFIIDIDAIPNAVLTEFFEKFFTNPNILKIGYHFTEDLVQLRSAVPRCPALYHPANLICIDRLVRMLMEESVKRPDVSLDGIVHPLVFNDHGNADDAEGNSCERDADVEMGAEGVAPPGGKAAVVADTAATGESAAPSGEPEAVRTGCDETKVRVGKKRSNNNNQKSKPEERAPSAGTAEQKPKVKGQIANPVSANQMSTSAKTKSSPAESSILWKNPLVPAAEDPRPSTTSRRTSPSILLENPFDDRMPTTASPRTSTSKQPSENPFARAAKQSENPFALAAEDPRPSTTGRRTSSSILLENPYEDRMPTTASLRTSTSKQPSENPFACAAKQSENPFAPAAEDPRPSTTGRRTSPSIPLENPFEDPTAEDPRPSTTGRRTFPSIPLENPFEDPMPTTASPRTFTSKQPSDKSSARAAKQSENPFARAAKQLFAFAHDEARRAAEQSTATSSGEQDGTLQYRNPFGFVASEASEYPGEPTPSSSSQRRGTASGSDNTPATEANNNVGAQKESGEEENGLLAPIKGLSALCERILGSPLDKAEQCSVWDRRPLRDLQLRYAALDAYAMIMLYEKCAEWAGRLGLSLSELCARQETFAVSLPLFCGD